MLIENHNLIKAAKDRRKTNSMKADYLIVIGKLTDDLIKIAYSNKIPIVEVKFN